MLCSRVWLIFSFSDLSIFDSDLFPSRIKISSMVIAESISISLNAVISNTKNGSWDCLIVLLTSESNWPMRNKSILFHFEASSKYLILFSWLRSNSKSPFFIPAYIRLRICWLIPFKTSEAGTPKSKNRASVFTKISSFFSKIDFVKSKNKSLLIRPKASITDLYSISSPQNAITWSSRLSASRILPSAFLDISEIDSLSKLIFSFSRITFKCCIISADEILLKSKRWHLEIIVGGILCTSVVQKINFAWLGGSSSVLRSALNAWLVSICTSSIIMTL